MNDPEIVAAYIKAKADLNEAKPKYVAADLAFGTAAENLATFIRAWLDSHGLSVNDAFEVLTREQTF